MKLNNLIGNGFFKNNKITVIIYNNPVSVRFIAMTSERNHFIFGMNYKYATRFI